MTITASADRNPLIQVFGANFPQGGGATSGLGESASTEGFTGAFALSVPLPTSELRLDPGLSLRYGSGQGNGPFGLGMALSLPSIRRLTRKGVPRYDAHDVFVFGDELESDAAGPTNGRDETITRYRRRLEGAFDRIELHEPNVADGSLATGDAYWLVHSADGTKHVFGKSASARTGDPGDPQRVAEWWLEESISPRGEHVHYAYKRDASIEDCTYQPHLKQVRFGNLRADAASWLLGGTDPAAEAWMFELVFDYGEHVDDAAQGPSYGPTLPWAVREDPFSRFDYGFELRCQRLCRRVLLFHRFAVLGTQPVAVREMRFEYATSPRLTRLIEIRIRGHRRDAGRLATEVMPPLALDYTPFTLADAGFRPLAAEAFIIDAQQYQLIDLYGEGIPGILYNDASGSSYRRPERVTRDADGLSVTYAAAPTQLHMPVGGAHPVALMDLTGDGTLDALWASPPRAGFFSRNSADGWQDFVPFSAFPSEFLQPFARLADLSGGGLSDLALIGPNSVRLFANRGRSGFAGPVDVAHAPDDPLPAMNEGGRTLTAFADILGSGQQHLIRVRYNELTCWPNLGHGRFGKARRLPIRMHASITEANFDPARLHLADLDGSGATDLVYFDSEAIHVHLNCSGNAFEDPATISFPAGVRYDNLDQVCVADLYGNGAAVLLLSKLHPQPQHWVYDPVRGVRPHLLRRINNNMGSETRLAYTSSSHEWLDERRENADARCALPFPVQVLQTMEIHDEISGNLLTQTSRYRGAHYSKEEREFCGFGLILRQDMESLDLVGNFDARGRPFTAPALTKTWYHTGAVNGDHVVGGYAGDPEAATLAATRFEVPEGEPMPDGASLHLALRGKVLRQETYGQDGNSRPFSVTSFRYCVRQLQAQGARRHPVLLSYELEQLGYTYERDPSDPQCHQSVTMEVDSYGVVTRTLALAYPRRLPIAGADPDYRDSQQELFSIVDERTRVGHLTDPGTTGWRIGLRIAASSGALVGVVPPGTGVYDHETLSASDGPLSNGVGVLAGDQRFIYADPLTGSPLPEGRVTVEALLCQVRSLEMSRAELEAAFANLQPPPDVDLPELEDVLVAEGGFQRVDDGFWNPGLLAHYAELKSFFAVTSHTGPLGAKTTYRYDETQLFVVEIVDAMDNRLRAVHDYQALLPMRIIDINDNLSEVAYDALGRLRLRSFQGTEPVFGTDTCASAGFGKLAEYTSSIHDLAGALQDPAGAIDNAAAVFFYESDSWMGMLERNQLVAAGVPAGEVEAVWHRLVACRWLTEEGHVQAHWRRRAEDGAEIARQAAPHAEALKSALASVRRIPPHNAELQADRYDSDPDPSQMQVRIDIVYSDGFGRVLQSKIRAEAGASYVIDARGDLLVDANGNPIEQETPERWLTSGRVAYNHKGQPTRQYIPYYINVPDYVDQESLDQPGYGDTLYYDPMDRVVEVLTASGHLRKTCYFAWRIVAEDENDTLAESPAFREAEASLRSVEIADICSGTPNVRVLNHADLTIRSVTYHRARTGEDRAARIVRSEHDVLGRMVSVSDPRFFALQQTTPATPGNERHRYASSGHVLTRESRDSGWRVKTVNALGEALITFDQRQQMWRSAFDRLGRLESVHVTSPGHAERCIERIAYGEAEADATTANLRGRIVRRFDSSGFSETRGYSISGWPMVERRRFLSDPHRDVDWPSDEGLAESWLEARTYSTCRRFDALGAELQLLDAGGHLRRNSYYASGRLSQSWLQLDGNAEEIVLNKLSYSPEHQRLGESAGNGIRTEYTYEPKTRRLLRSVATRVSDGAVLQDLSYTHDPVGNILSMHDVAESARFHRAQASGTQRDYRYDSLYQLIGATGCEHTSAGPEAPGPTPPPHDDDDIPVVNYTREFEYDIAGNLTAVLHAGAQIYTQARVISSVSNRAIEMRPGLTPDMVESQFDPHGNLCELAPGQRLSWHVDDRLRQAVQVERENEEDDAESYGYGTDGRRVRKWRQWQVANLTRKAEVRYLPELELRTDSSTGEQFQIIRAGLAGRANLRVLRWSAGRPSDMANDQHRYQLDDHLGSAMLELDATGRLLSAEEYYPYGGTAVWWAERAVDAGYKMARYSGKERDITGLYDYGQRYYAPWLARWISADPAGAVDGPNLYRMVRNNPMVAVDPDGMAPTNAADEANKAYVRMFDKGQAWTAARYQGSKDYAGFQQQSKLNIDDLRLITLDQKEDTFLKGLESEPLYAVHFSGSNFEKRFGRGITFKSRMELQGGWTSFNKSNTPQVDLDNFATDSFAFFSVELGDTPHKATSRFGEHRYRMPIETLRSTEYGQFSHIELNDILAPAHRPDPLFKLKKNPPDWLDPLKLSGFTAPIMKPNPKRGEPPRVTALDMLFEPTELKQALGLRVITDIRRSGVGVDEKMVYEASTSAARDKIVNTFYRPQFLVPIKASLKKGEYVYSHHPKPKKKSGAGGSSTT